MKTLTLIRHAKSSWSHPGLDDFERPLNKRGMRDAPAMGKRLAVRGMPIEWIVSSPAARAITTARVIAVALAYPVDRIQEEPDIYAAGLGELVEVLRGLPMTHNHIALVGHNPGFTDLANYLADAEIANMPTCGLVHVQLPISDWAEVDRNSGQLVFFDYPKNKSG